MIIKYYSHDRQIVERDLSKEKILSWEIHSRYGWAEKGGNLDIIFDTSHLAIVGNEGGIYPPVADIINFDEVLSFLKKNYSDKRVCKA